MEAGKGQRRRKQPRKISPRSLENVALHYLKRYAATVRGVRRVLVRRVDRSLKVHGGDREEALGWVEALLAKLVRNGLLDDVAFAQMKARSLRAAGRSSRLIAQKLRLKGVPDDVLAEQVASAASEISEAEAARTWARRKRLGPYRLDPRTRGDNRERDMGRLARAGFSYDVVREVIDAPG